MVIAEGFKYDKQGKLLGYIQTQVGLALGMDYGSKQDRLQRMSIKEMGSRTPFLAYHYSYDAAGNIYSTFRDEQSSNGEYLKFFRAYEYNSQNQLIQMETRYEDHVYQGFKDSQKSTYSFDVGGSMKQLTYSLGELKYTYQSDSHQLDQMRHFMKGQSKAWVEFDYDPNGNLIQKIAKDDQTVYEKWTYHWDARNRLKEQIHDQKIRGSIYSQRNYYDHVTGLRYKKINLNKGERTTRSFIYDSEEKLLSDDYRYIYLGRKKLARFWQDKQGKTVVSYYQNDHLGTPLWISYRDPDTQQLRHDRYMMGPWGNLIESQSIRGLNHGQQYTGKYQDKHFLYYFHARHYDPFYGQRFLSQDSKKPQTLDIWSWNPYIYAYNNPLRFYDPNGREGFDYWEDMESIPPVWFSEGLPLLFETTQLSRVTGYQDDRIQAIGAEFTGNFGFFKNQFKVDIYALKGKKDHKVDRVGSRFFGSLARLEFLVGYNKFIPALTALFTFNKLEVSHEIEIPFIKSFSLGIDWEVGTGLGGKLDLGGASFGGYLGVGGSLDFNIIKRSQ